MFLHAKEDIDSRLDWAGCGGLQSEMRYGFTSDGVLLDVHGEDNLGDVLELIDWGACGEELVPNE